MPGRLIGTLIAAAAVGAAAFAANKAVKAIKENQEKEAAEKARAMEWGDRKVYIIGAGVSALSAAAYLVRDCGMKGENIHVISGSDKVGGVFACESASPASVSAFISKNASENLMDLLGSIPSIEAPQRSVAEEIMNYSAAHPVSAKARMVVGSGEISELSSMQLDGDDRSQMLKLIFADEKNITDLRIDQWFAEHFFTTDFWYLWQSAYGIRRWDSLAELRRQIRRNAASLGDLDTLSDRINTPYDIYDSVILPLKAYLDRAGVCFELGNAVSDIEFTEAVVTVEEDEEETEEAEETAESEDTAEPECGCSDADDTDDAAEVIAEAAETVAEDVKEAVAETVGAAETAETVAEAVKEEAADAAESAADAIAETVEAAEAAVSGAAETVAEAVETEAVDTEAPSPAPEVIAENIADDKAECEPETALESECCCETENECGCAKKCEADENCCESGGGCECSEGECDECDCEGECEGCDGCGDGDDLVIVPTAILFEDGRRVDLGEQDVCILTLGAGSGYVMTGTADTPAFDENKLADRPASLWELLSSDCPELGDASRFFADVKGSAVESFAFTFKGSKLVKLFENFSGNAAGSGGTMTFRDSGWLLSVNVPAQPVSRDQEDGTTVISGVGLYPESVGTYVKKPMKDATGSEILYEIVCHMQWADRWEEIRSDLISAVPVYSPFASAALLPRSESSRPDVIPDGTVNLAVIGSYADVDADTTGTIEYAVRTARTAVYRLAGTKLEAAPVPNDILKPDKALKALQVLFK